MDAPYRLPGRAGRSAVVAFIAVLLWLSSAGATDLRGRVDGMHPYSPQPFPIGGVRIDIFAPSPQGTVLVRSTLTGGDGMYYLPGMAPGVYTLVVNGFLQFPSTFTRLHSRTFLPSCIDDTSPGR
jgi:hypothetical protein